MPRHWRTRRTSGVHRPARGGARHWCLEPTSSFAFVEPIVNGQITDEVEAVAMFLSGQNVEQLLRGFPRSSLPRMWPRWAARIAVRQLVATAAAFSDDELARISRRFERSPAADIIRWAVDSFAPHLCLTTSMQDAVLVDLAVRVEPAVEVVFIDTGYHFPETLEMVDAVRRRYGLNLRIMTAPPTSEALWEVDPENCCSPAKVAQLDRALAGKAAWMSGIRWVETAHRSAAPIVAREARGLVKVNPLATWSDAAVENYIRDHDLPVHPLRRRGYPSIGCMPCTTLPVDSNDPRSGRWPGRNKTECGMHF